MMNAMLKTLSLGLVAALCACGTATLHHDDADGPAMPQQKTVDETTVEEHGPPKETTDAPKEGGIVDGDAEGRHEKGRHTGRWDDRPAS